MLPELSPMIWAVIIAIALSAGFVKGSVGFAMPTIMVSGLGSVLHPAQALAALIIPTLIANGMQTLRGGVPEAIASIRRQWRYISVMLVMIVFSAQLVTALPETVLFLIIGVPVVVFALIQLAGFRPVIAEHRRRLTEVLVGAFAGFLGGLSGSWGPPTVLYLTALNTPKAEQLRVQGIVYGLAAMVLAAAHIRSGVFNAQTAPLSAILLFPALLGTLIGFRVADRLNQERFRQATLIVLVLAGLNLVRRGLMG
ncbi:MAG: sulfite exporter TauE/SafE family protein [Pseudomonadota bacterium]